MAKKLYLLNHSLSNASLPEVTEADNGKVLGVVDGVWGVVDAPASSDYENYEGPYAVTPSDNDQVLETSQNVLDEDITIKAVPYTEVSNTGGGTTVNIGGL